MTDLDPRLTFDMFVVGPANRLAAAAARRAADSPGTSYNPLFVYSSSGLGKSHILAAVAHHAEKVHPELQVVYQTLEGYLGELTAALEAGDQDGLQSKYEALDLLLLDDVQFLTGQSEAQEMLLCTLDSMSGSGKQIVLASDRPPADINGLDARLLSRFSGGLIVDIGPPEYETRVAIIRKKTEERGQTLAAGVPEAVAKHPYNNVRELQGGLNRILAIQDLEDRQVTAVEVNELLGSGDNGGGDDAQEFFAELSEEVAHTVDEQEAPWRKKLRSAIEEADGQGFSTVRLRHLMEGDSEPGGVNEAIAEFKSAVERLIKIKENLDAAGNPWPEAALAVVKDPERLEEAETLLASARERVRAFPVIPDGSGLGELPGTYPSLPVKAAHRLATSDRPDYNPLFVSCPSEERTKRMLAATGRTFLEAHPGGRVAMISAADFAEDFIRALSAGVAGAWRERWWTVELLLLYGAEALSETERAQDEFFHLFEALKRREARIFLAADRPPAGIEDIDERLRSRFEGGLVVEMETASAEVEAEEKAQAGATDPTPAPEPVAVDEAPAVPPLDELELADDGRGGLFPGQAEEAAAAPEPTPVAEAPASEPAEDGGARPRVVLDGPDAASPADLVPTGAPKPAAPAARGKDGWSPSRENVVWSWPVLEDRLVEDVD